MATVPTNSSPGLEGPCDQLPVIPNLTLESFLANPSPFCVLPLPAEATFLTHQLVSEIVLSTALVLACPQPGLGSTSLPGTA